jgi:hypothetical protein
LAKTVATKANGISMSIAICTSFLIGYLADRLPPSYIILFSYGFTVIGIILFHFVEFPDSGLLYLSAVII